MRSHEGNEAQVCYFIIQLLLLKPNDFRNRVSDFVKENSPEHWLQNDWHTKHMNYHKVLAPALLRLCRAAGEGWLLSRQISWSSVLSLWSVWKQISCKVTLMNRNKL